MHNSLYIGWVRHRRYTPSSHTFRYKLFMVCLDLDTLESVFKGRWLWSAHHPNLAWLRRRDHLGSTQETIKESVLALVQEKLGFRPAGPVFLLTHLRYFGHNFNPVSFYYCHDGSGSQIEAIVAEINNTPWGERYSYVLDARGQTGAPIHAFRLDKCFHVSPFMPMAQIYDWRFSTPGSSLIVHMTNEQDGIKVFDATLNLERHAITSANLALALSQFPLMTLKVVAAIYWQAFRLWLKRTPFHAHPDKPGKEKLP